MLECLDLLEEQEGTYAGPLAEINDVLLQMMLPAIYRPDAEHNAERLLARGFEDACLELKTHYHVQNPKALSLYDFVHHLDYFERAKGSKQAI
ncbi:hypothetical protein [Hymenobacter guriensis]|uniref:Uncharacterized protein n=1 Tax=Hymenobacter guriensis TaxID=2793065 RepID=A0ABS0L7N2_9BACT|nr:hypothetical protein [Hymenobacter guriensis]MBG8556158.1 hypothetical protein [Hymenobacter guriensis]